MSIELVKGQNISVVLYTGTSKLEAESLYNYLDGNYKNNTWLLLNGTDFSLRITDVIVMTSPDLFKDCTVYTIEVKGELR